MTQSQVRDAAGTRNAKSPLLAIDIALDATPHSQEVIANLSRFISPQAAVCHFLYVLPTPPSDDRKFAGFDEEVQQETARLVNQQFDDYARTLAQQQLVVQERHFIQHAKSIEEGILTHIEQEAPDLLVLGMHEAGSPKGRMRISATSNAIATHAPGSVLVVKHPKPAMASLKVLFATDGSAHAQQAATMLMRFLPTQGTHLSILNVVSVNAYVLPVVEPFVDYGPLEHAMQGEATQMLENTRQHFESAGYHVGETLFTLGDPVEQILAEAEKQQADLIVLGSHGTGARLTQWLLGSVSSRVLQYSPTSVAILR